MAGQRTQRATVRATSAAAALLAAASITWAAYPLHGGRAGTRIALIVAIVAGVLSIARLALAGAPRITVPFLASAGRRAVDWLLTAVTEVPWAEGMLVAVLVLGALHPARPWHTGVLGLAVLAYLLALHLAESRAAPGVLRAQRALLAAGAGLLILAVGAAALPGLPTGKASLLAGASAVIAAVLVAAIALPGTGGGQR